MKMKKANRLVALLLSLLMLLGTLPAALAEDSAVVTDSEYEKLQAEAVQQYYDRLMATTTLAEAEAIAREIANEQGLNFVAKLSDDQQAALEAKYDTLVAEYEASQTPTDTEEEIVDDRTIVYPTVDYTNAAPFGDPVEGAAPAMFALMRAATVAEENDNGLSLNKYISEPDANGVYTLTLEAWATGAKVTSIVTEEIPTDIILVLDQSGSMAYDFTSVTYDKYSGTLSEMYTNRNSLYVKLSNGNYAPVSISRATVSTQGYTLYSGQSNSTYYDNRSNLYHKCNDGSYGKVTVTRSGSQILFWNNYKYTYTCANGCTLEEEGGADDVPSFNANLYVPATGTQYTFSYENESGQTVTAQAMETESAPNWEFYLEKAGGNTNRLDALKSAVTTFANSVAAKTTETVDHRIAIVGFSSSGYNNTEILTGCTITTGSQNYGTTPSQQGTAYYYPAGYAKNGVQYSSTGYEAACGTALVAANSDSVKNAIAALTAHGGTQTADGVAMAKNILDANRVPTGEKRNRVVIVFSDGIPGQSGYDSTVATNAINNAAEIKTAGVTVYTVGIFDGADATTAGSTGYNSSDADKGNYFMQRLSSNTSYPQEPSYYLSASNASALNNIFKTISDNIESGGSLTTLDENTVVKDVLTDQFVLPDGTDPDDIKVYTATYTAANTFAEPVEFTDAVPNISEDGKTISVTNFDFAENFVGTETAADGTVTYRGKKLIIQIPIKVRDGFLGGNDVVTNATGSAVYEDADAVTNNDPVEEFESPTVDVEIKDITVTALDYNVYLLGDVAAADIEAALTVKVGNIALDMDAENYGLQSWQNAYVNISEGDEAVSDFTDLTADATYNASCTVTPKTTGTATEKSGSDTGNISVFKPVLTFQDSKEKYMTTMEETDAKAYYAANNCVSEVWTHDNTLSTAVTMTGDKPTLVPDYDLTYAEDDTALFDSAMKVVAKNDVKVNVTVAIGEADVTTHTTSIRNACTCTELDKPCDHTEKTSSPAMGNDPEFVVHIYDVYGDLAITKTVSGDPATGVATTFDFKVELSASGTFNYTITDAEGNAVAVTDAEGNVVANPTITSGGMITLANGQTATISDLPPEATYTVTETVPAGYVSSENPVTGSIVAGSTVTASFTNTYTIGSLTVSKTVIGEDAPADDEFEFTVTLNPAISGTFGDATFTDGVATITMKGGESKIITGLPINATYTVVEAADEDYDTIKTGENGTISTTGSTAAFTNTYKYGSLTITKAFNGCTPQAGETFLFTVTGPNGFDMDIVIAGAGSITIEHLPLGTYTVTEDNAWSWRYTSNPASASDEITATENGSVTFTNSLTENKWLDGNTSAENNFNGTQPATVPTPSNNNQ